MLEISWKCFDYYFIIFLRLEQIAVLDSQEGEVVAGSQIFASERFLVGSCWWDNSPECASKDSWLF